MKNERLLGLVGFALAIAGAILLLRDGVNFRLTIESVLAAIPPLALGLVAVVGAFFLVTRRYVEGGLLCAVVGILALVLSAGMVPTVVVLLGGVLGLVAAAS